MHCPYCKSKNKDYKYKYALDIHILFHHSDNSAKKCPYCSKEYNTECGLSSHARYCKLNPDRVEVSLQTRRLISAIHTSMKMSDDTKQKISQKNKGRESKRKGQALSDDHKAKLSKAHKGKKLSDECKEKLRQINTGKKLSDDHKRKIGDSNRGHITTEEQKDKTRKTCEDRYGHSCYLQSKVGKEKTLATCKEKYGANNYMQSEQAKLDSIEKYGTDHPCQSKQVKDKAIETNISKYGANHFAQTLEAHKHRKSHIFYNGEYFDSQPELDFYIECLNEGKSIVRHPTRLEYVYNNKKHYYIPDFSVDGKLVEIKGSQFLNLETNKWMNPYDRSQDGLYEAKYDCAISNNVEIIYV